MREFNVRAYEDHWIVQEEGGPAEIVEGTDDILKAIAWQPWVAPPTVKVVKKKRKRRTKAELEAIEYAKHVKAKVEDNATTV